METYRLKNIAIVILLLLDGFLLVLLGWQSFRSRRSAADAAQQLRALYAARDIALSQDVDLGQEPLRALQLSRRSGTERSIAAYLLGADPVSASQGGGIVSFATEHGSIQFRAGGGFAGGSLAREIADPEDFARGFCSQFGYEDLDFSYRGGVATASATQCWEGVPIAGCQVSLRFEDGSLTAVTGAHVSLTDAEEGPAERMDCVTALVRFLDYRESSSIVCGAVTDLSCVYALEGDTAALRLLPVWQVETDTYTYLVDCATGEVTRRP